MGSLSSLRSNHVQDSCGSNAGANPAVNPGANLSATYLRGSGALLLTDGRTLGLRRDHNGVLLLDSALQAPMRRAEDIVKVELPRADATLLLNALRSTPLPGADFVSEVLEELSRAIDESAPQLPSRSGAKGLKWASAILKISHLALKGVATALVSELKRQNRHVPALAVASAVAERLNSLLVEEQGGSSAAAPGVPDRSLMFSECARKATFSRWPHMNYRWALPDQMAQAGFYHQPNATGDDRAMCFTCNVCLVCWEPTDEPWSEHERHSPSCPFVRGEFTQNVPLSVALGAAPALPLGRPGASPARVRFGATTCPDLAPALLLPHTVAVWNVAGHLKKEPGMEVHLNQVLRADKAASLLPEDVEATAVAVLATAGTPDDGSTKATLVLALWSCSVNRSYLLCCQMDRPHTSPPSPGASPDSSSPSDTPPDSPPPGNSASPGIRAFQSLTLPEIWSGMQIVAMEPTEDGGHILLAVSPGDGGDGGGFLVYQLRCGSAGLEFEYQPVLQRKCPSDRRPCKLLLLPLESDDGDESSVKDGRPCGLFVVLDLSGAFYVIDTSDLTVAAAWQQCHEHGAFLDVAYCASVERVYASCPGGHLHVFSLPLGAPAGQPLPDVGVAGDLDLATLRQLHRLTRFETLAPAVSCTAPPCWVEISQSRKGGGTSSVSRTFRLQRDRGSCDQHTFEITLPRRCCVGHVDVRFTLHPGCAGATSDIHVSLAEPSNTDVDSTIDFLASGNTLCGPLDLAPLLDLSGTTGLATLTSYDLLASRSRTYLVTLTSKRRPSWFGTPRPPPPKKEQLPEKLLESMFGHLFPYPGQNFQNVILAPNVTNALSQRESSSNNNDGHDWLAEVTVTVRKVTAGGSRNERLAMLSDDLFLQRLVALCGESEGEACDLALEIALWVLAIRFQSPERADGALSAVLSGLGTLVPRCLLFATRSMAHRCARILILCLESGGDGGTSFADTLLGHLLHWLPSSGKAQHSGALHWFFLVLARVAIRDPRSCGKTLLTTLLQAAKQLDHRVDRAHSILRAKYGLYGCPLEQEMYDLESSCVAKSTSTVLTYAGVVACHPGDHPSAGTVLVGPGGISAGLSHGMAGSGGLTTHQVVGGGSGPPPPPPPASAGHMIATTTADILAPFNHGGSSWSGVIHAGGGGGMGGGGRGRGGASGGGQQGKKFDLRDLVCVGSNGAQGGASKAVLPTGVGWCQLQGLLESEPLHFTCHSASDGTRVERAEPQAKVMAAPSAAAAASPGNSADAADATSASGNTDDASPSAAASDSALPTCLKPTPQEQSASWQHLATLPAQQTLVIERMHSGARRFVVLDFGCPVLLSDVWVPSCPDLLTLTLDAWEDGEDRDGTRLATCTDIGARPLVLPDLQPPLRCRYLRLTAVGRHGMSTTRCRIPVGCFYGVPVRRPEHRRVLGALLEDMRCRYALSCGRLRSMMSSQCGNMFVDESPDEELTAVYRECQAYRQQLNVVRGAIKRLGGTAKGVESPPSTEQLAALTERCVDVLLNCGDGVDVSSQECQDLFRRLCVSQGEYLRLATAALLVRRCSSAPWWGQFLSRQLQDLFGQSQNAIFPRDRVFLLLAWMAQKSAREAGCGAAIVEAVLEPAACGQLQDPQLLDWTLLYVSLVMDVAAPQRRAPFDFLHAEMAMSANGNHIGDPGGNPMLARLLSRRLPRVVGAKMVAKTAELKKAAMESSKPDKKKKKGKIPAVLRIEDLIKAKDEPEAEEAEVQCLVLNRPLVLAVCKSLLGMLCGDSETPGWDSASLACKVIARLAHCCQPTIGVRELADAQRLATLVRQAVAPDSNARPWLYHSLATLLQELLRAERDATPPPSASSSVTAIVSVAGPSTAEEPTTSNNNDTETTGTIVVEELDAAALDPLLIEEQTTGADFPSPTDSDSEVENLMENAMGGILDRRCSGFRRAAMASKAARRAANAAAAATRIDTSMSTAIDARMELGLDVGAEVRLRRIAAAQADVLSRAVATPLVQPAQRPAQPATVTAQADSSEAVRHCFDTVFSQLHSPDAPVSLELLLQLWLSLRSDAPGGLSDKAVFGLLQALAYHPGITLRAWTLALEVLSGSECPGQGTLPQVLMRFLSEDHCGMERLVGPTACKRLGEVLDVAGYGLALDLARQLIQPGGAISNHYGAIDAQMALVSHLLARADSAGDSIEIGSAVALAQDAGRLAYQHLAGADRLRCGRAPEEPAASLPYDQGLLLSVLSGKTTSEQRLSAMVAAEAALSRNIPESSERQLRATPETLLCAMLALVSKIVRPRGAGTDEQKCVATPLADAVVAQQPTVLRLLSGLSVSSDGSDAVPEATFQLALALAQSSSSHADFIKPLVAFFKTGLSSGACHMSDALLRLVVRVLELPGVVDEFERHSGLATVCANVVWCCQAPAGGSTGLVSMMMHHLGRRSVAATSGNGAPTVVGFDAGFVTGVSSRTKAELAESTEGMVNFAPFGRVTCQSRAAAQPPEILVQACPPHRRARTPAWSYHLMPTEDWVELVVTLPAAVLLREVHLQPHLSSLATCPSAVSVEVGGVAPSTQGASSQGSGSQASGTSQQQWCPLGPPLRTSGATLVRLRLDPPEVTSSILLRLYRPRDSSNIGLSQVRLLGTTAFGETLPQERRRLSPQAATSANWLVLLEAVLRLEQQLSEQQQGQTLMDKARTYPALVESVASLLATSPPPPSDPTCPERLLLLILLSPPVHHGAIIVALHNLLSVWRHLVNVDSAVHVLFRLCTVKGTDSNTAPDAVLEAIGWLYSAANRALACGTLSAMQPCAAYVQAIACALWDAGRARISREVFLTLSDWALALPAQESLRLSAENVVCAACAHQPALFEALLCSWGVPLATDGGATSNQSDDSKLKCCEATASEVAWLQGLDENKLALAGRVARSKVAFDILLQSGVLPVLIHAITDFCDRTSPEAPSRCLTAHQVGWLLDCLASWCLEGTARDWLGGPEGSSFWLPLLRLLCVSAATQLDDCDRSSLEDGVVVFLSRCCSAHPKNQRHLAKTLCDVLRQRESSASDAGSGFTRRLVLQLLLEDERIIINLVSMGDDPVTLRAGPTALPSVSERHPRFGVGHHHQVVAVTTGATCASVLQSVLDAPAPPVRQARPREMSLSDLADQLSLAAGIFAKDKRAKETPPERPAAPAPTSAGYELALESHSLASEMTLSQVLRQAADTGAALSDGYLTLEVRRKTASAGMSTAMLASALDEFTALGGLSLLARHLPLVYPSAGGGTGVGPRVDSAGGTKNGAGVVLGNSVGNSVGSPPEALLESDWVKVDNEDFYEDYEDMSGAMMANSISHGSKSASPVAPPSVPPHSLAALGTFLRLPGYAELLLEDRRKARLLLRLVLGVSDDGAGGDILASPSAPSLPTLPFQVLRRLFHTVAPRTDDGMLLRAATVEVGALQLLLASLALFTHLPSGGNNSSSTACPGAKAPEDRYWAKGTGFGTGSVAQSWDVEQALLRQRSEEEYVTVLLQVLASYLQDGDGCSANGDMEEEQDSMAAVLPDSVPDALAQSCLIPALASYLRNDSVLDMARHVPLYRAVLATLRALASCQTLAPLLMPNGHNSCSNGESAQRHHPPVHTLLARMKSCVDTYASRLRGDATARFKSKSKATQTSIESPGVLSSPAPADHTNSEADEGMATLIPDIRLTYQLVQNAAHRMGRRSFPSTNSDDGSDDEPTSSGAVSRPLRQRDADEVYVEAMRRLQFDTYEMIVDAEADPDSGTSSGVRFAVSHHFEANVRSSGSRSLHPERLKRLAQEAVTLSTSLPLSASSSVFVRCDVDRLDVMKVLITGPADTPYANGCFEFDVFFPADYPAAPMLVNLETTGHRSVRFNPNLYSDGKVCLSVLNTWHGRPEEKWNPSTSSFLQVLVSIQSLILVPEPYFNEPGYERSRGTSSGNQSSREYNSNVRQACVRWAVLEQLRNPSACFREAVHTHFWLKRKQVLQQVQSWLEDAQAQASQQPTARALTLNAAAMKRHYAQLKKELAKLQRPSGLPDDLADDDDDADDSATAGTSGATSDAAVDNNGSATVMSTTPTDNGGPQPPGTPPDSSTADDNGTLVEDDVTPGTPDDEASSASPDFDQQMEDLVCKVCNS